MTARFTITIPTVSNDGAPAEHYAETARTLIIGAGFVGFTETRGNGYWTNGLGRAFSEPVAIFTIDTDADEPVSGGAAGCYYRDAISAVRAIASELARACAQECVYVTRTDSDGFENFFIEG